MVERYGSRKICMVSTASSRPIWPYRASPLPLSIGDICLTIQCTGRPSGAPDMDTIPISECLDRDAQSGMGDCI